MPDIFVSQPKNTPKLKFDQHQSPLSAFCYFPKKIHFETKDQEEKVVLLLRRHPITNLPWIIVAILMILAPLLVSFFPILSFMPERFQIVAILGWYLVTTAFIIENFLIWFFNVNIVTDERIIDIDFHNLIYKEMTDSKIDKIQEVNLRMGGVIQIFFDYGDVLVQTASEIPTMDFLSVPHPDKVVKILQDLVIEEEQEKMEGRVR